jgi:hypothetical protein
MSNFYRDEEHLELEIIRLKQCVNSRDFQEAAKVAKRISAICKCLKPNYDYSCNLGDFERIMSSFSVDYGVGKWMPEVVWQKT